MIQSSSESSGDYPRASFEIACQLEASHNRIITSTFHRCCHRGPEFPPEYPLSATPHPTPFGSSQLIQRRSANCRHQHRPSPMTRLCKHRSGWLQTYCICRISSCLLWTKRTNPYMCSLGGSKQHHLTSFHLTLECWLSLKYSVPPNPLTLGRVLNREACGNDFRSPR